MRKLKCGKGFRSINYDSIPILNYKNLMFCIASEISIFISLPCGLNSCFRHSTQVRSKKKAVNWNIMLKLNQSFIHGTATRL